MKDKCYFVKSICSSWFQSIRSQVLYSTIRSICSSHAALHELNQGMHHVQTAPARYPRSGVGVSYYFCTCLSPSPPFFRSPSLLSPFHPYCHLFLLSTFMEKEKDNLLPSQSALFTALYMLLDFWVAWLFQSAPSPWLTSLCLLAALKDRKHPSAAHPQLQGLCCSEPETLCKLQPVHKAHTLQAASKTAEQSPKPEQQTDKQAHISPKGQVPGKLPDYYCLIAVPSFCWAAMVDTDLVH